MEEIIEAMRFIGATAITIESTRMVTIIAPIPQEMVLNYLGSHVLHLPRSY